MDIIITNSGLYKKFIDNGFERNATLDYLDAINPFIDLTKLTDDELDSSEINDYVEYYEIDKLYINFLKFRYCVK
jgi:hypothetical protein